MEKSPDSSYILFSKLCMSTEGWNDDDHHRRHPPPHYHYYIVIIIITVVVVVEVGFFIVTC